MSDYYKREDVEQIMKSYGIGGTTFVDDLLKPSGSEEERQKEVWASVRNVLDRVAINGSELMPKWIPCEERLPENESEILVTDANGHIRHAFYDAECDWFGTYEESMTIRAIAWMPLPEPYRGEREDDER